MLAFSVLLTPLIVRGLVKGGIQNGAATMGGAILATAALTPTDMLRKIKRGADRVTDVFQRGDEPDDDYPQKKSDPRRR